MTLRAEGQSEHVFIRRRYAKRQLQHRGSVEMALDLLGIVHQYDVPTNRVYKANLEWKNYKKKMKMLEAVGLVNGDEITPAGLKVLECWRLIRTYFPYKWLEDSPFA